MLKSDVEYLKGIIYIAYKRKCKVVFFFFFFPLDGMLVHRRVTPSIKFSGTHLWREALWELSVLPMNTTRSVPGQVSNSYLSIRNRAH